ncbi:TetR family transcriptional regulator [Brevibacillus formosus]|uniref:TetR family transcriptional regulator n=1 Tax=Brevibacillus formosus TaxID=54913 RepID=A0A220MNV3_9BACL|nr:TetR family transcriptional regulator [Brevibacillus formosus]ASJ56874.1 TetR family transcriptional regulator [Brevibacillus formosus]
MAISKDDKYSKILKAAIEIISEKGLDKTSISDIVKKAGIAQGTFYLYFPSKMALVPAIADNLLSITFQRINDKLLGKSDIESVLEVLVDETFSFTDEYRDVIILCYSGFALDNSLETWGTIYKPFYEWMEGVLVKAINDNAILKDIDVRWTAKIIITLIENTAERYYSSDQKNVAPDEYKAEILRFCKRALGIQ